MQFTIKCSRDFYFHYNTVFNIIWKGIRAHNEERKIFYNMLAKYKFISKRKITLLFIILHLCLESFRQKMSNSITMRIVIQYRIQPQPIIYYRIIILKKVMYKFWKPTSTYWSYLVGKTFLNKRLLSAVYIFFH